MFFASLLVASLVSAQTKEPPGNYGALVQFSGLYSTTVRCNKATSVLKQLNANVYRDGITIGINENVPLMPFDLVLNINTKYGGKFTKDTAQYRRDLVRIFTKLKKQGNLPVLAVCENEDGNINADYYPQGNVTDYINEFIVFVDVSSQFGVEATNGGFLKDGLKYLTYLKLPASEQKGFAKAASLPLHNSRTIQTAGYIQSFCSAVAGMKKVRNVNVHFYLDDTSTYVISKCLQTVKDLTGKGVFSNEFGSYVTNPDVTTAITTAFRKAGATYMLYYSRDGNGKGGGKAIALHNEDGTLRPAGKAFAAQAAVKR